VTVLFSSNRAQVEMMETILIAVIFVILLVVALAFYFKFSAESVEQTAENVCLVSNTVLLASIAATPEIACSIEGQREPCIDTTKLLVFDPNRDRLPYSTICSQKVSFEQVYPVPDNDVVCTSNTYPDCTIYPFSEPEGTSVEAGIRISTPVTLYYPLTEDYKLGRLVIEIFP